MKDRLPLYPGRVKLVPVSGQENVYNMTRADQPTQDGDPLNKATLLKDATAAQFGLGTDAVPDDVLALLSKAALYKTITPSGLYDVSGNLLLKLPGVQIATGSYVGTGKYGSSNPNSLTFEFDPKIVIIRIDEYDTSYGAIFIQGQTKGVGDARSSGLSSSAHLTVSWPQNGISFYGKNYVSQLNQEGITYRYFSAG